MLFVLYFLKSRSDIRSIIIALLHSSTIDVNSTVSDRDSRTALHLAAAMGNLAVVQILIWNHADLHARDHEGRTCLSYAKTALSLIPTQLTNETLYTQNSLESAKNLIEILKSLGCTDPLIQSTGSFRDMIEFEKLPSSII